MADLRYAELWKRYLKLVDDYTTLQEAFAALKVKTGRSDYMVF